MAKKVNDMEIVKNIWTSFHTTIFPPVCLMCDALVIDTGQLCANCWAKIDILEHPLCPITGRPMEYGEQEGMVSVGALMQEYAFDRVCSVSLYSGATKRLIQLLKFADRTDLAPWLSQWMVNFAHRTVPEFLEDDLIVIPVPLHWRRLATRYFNQSAELAREFCALTNQIYDPGILYRSREVKTQMGLRRHQRLQNLRGVFKIAKKKKSMVKGGKFLLIDDVFTTGATLQACSLALRRAGAEKVVGLTLSRVA